MEWMDQGQLLYPSWRVSQGAVPLRDFAQMYGPSTFLFVGFLLRMFGTDVFVVRMSLILVKAAIALVAYAITRRIASRPAALAALALDVAVLGTPWWLFNTPYPNHYALLINLAGFWVFLAWARRPVAASVLAGFCFGLSATFKQTLGVFALVALVWFAIFQRAEPQAAARDDPNPRAIRVLRWIVLAGSFLLFAGYAAKYPHAWTYGVLLGPIAAIVILLARREVVAPPSRADHARGVQIVLGAGAGFAVPIAIMVACYASLGALDRLLFSTATVPAAMDWFVPIELPKARTVLLFVVALAAAQAAVHRRATVWAVSAGALAIFFWSVARAEGLPAYLRTEAWIGEIFSVVFWLPVVLCWLELVQISLVTSRGDAEKMPVENGAVLMSFYGVAALQHLYPAGDFWHLLNMLPVYTILLGHQLARLAARERGKTPNARVVVAVALVAFLVLPFSYALARARLDRAPRAFSIPRLGGIFDPSPKFADAAAVLSFLADPERATRGLLVVANEQMLYFAAGRPSIWDGEEFLLYLVQNDLVRGEGARALLDEPALLGRLAKSRPLIVDYEGSPGSQRLWEAFPTIGSHVKARYHQTARFGRYVVLDDRSP